MSKPSKTINRNGNEEAAQKLAHDLQAVGQVWKFRVWLIKDTVLRMNTETGESHIFNYDGMSWSRIKEPDDQARLEEWTRKSRVEGITTRG